MVPAGDGNTPQYTGEWRDGYELSIALSRGGNEVTLLTPSIGKHEAVVRAEIDSVANSEGVKLHYAGFILNRRLGSYMTIRMTLAWLLEYVKLKPDLIIFKQARADFGLLIPGVKKRTMVLTCDLSNHALVPKAPMENNSLIYRAPKRFELILNSICKLVLFPLAVLRPVVKQYFYIGLLVAPKSQKLESHPTVNLRSQKVIDVPKGFLSYPDTVWQSKDHFYQADIVFCGVIGLNKGVFEVLEAWKHLTVSSTLSIVGVGTPEMQEKLKQIISTTKGVSYLGGIGYFEKFALFNEAKMLVLPSKSDYYPSVIFEAFAVGLPVITTREIASPVRDGKNGILIDSKDVLGLANAIEKLLLNETDRKRMAECAKKSASEYSWDIAVKQISLILGQ